MTREARKKHGVPYARGEKPFGCEITAMICDCEHHTHEPSGTQAAAAHEFGAAESVACLDAGHMQGTQVR